MAPDRETLDTKPLPLAPFEGTLVPAAAIG